MTVKKLNAKRSTTGQSDLNVSPRDKLINGGIKMSSFKAENVKKCVSLLREFIGESSTLNKKKETAILALNQLQKITAGTSSGDNSGSDNSTSSVGTSCDSRPRGDNP